MPISSVFTIFDIRYRFRVAVSPFPLFKICLVAIALLGLCFSLGYRRGAAEGWSNFLEHQDRWQAALGLIFLCLIFIWAFSRSKCNAKKFAQHLYLLILKGADTELLSSDELRFKNYIDTANWNEKLFSLCPATVLFLYHCLSAFFLASPLPEKPQTSINPLKIYPLEVPSGT